MPLIESRSKRNKLKGYRQEEEIKIGDLVNHVLYDKSWIGLVLDIDMELDALKKEGRALVKMVPGTCYEFHFGLKWLKKRAGQTKGWISLRWVRKVKYPSNVEKKLDT